MKNIVKFVFIIIACLITSGCMITDKVKKIGERSEHGYIADAYLLQNGNVYVRSKIEICNDIGSSGSHNYVCGEKFNRDTLWVLGDKIIFSNTLSQNNGFNCTINIHEFGYAKEIIQSDIKYDDKINNIHVSLNDSNWVERRKLLCAANYPMFFTDNGSAASLYIKNKTGFNSYFIPYPKQHDVQVNSLVVVRYLLLPFAVVADVATAPIQFMLDIASMGAGGGMGGR